MYLQVASTKKEYYCQSIMMGDLYDDYFLGMNKLDKEKKIFYYNNKLKYGQKDAIGLNRLAYFYQDRMDYSIKKHPNIISCILHFILIYLSFLDFFKE